MAAHGGRSAGDAQLNGQLAMDVQMDEEAHAEGACFCLQWSHMHLAAKADANIPGW